jgi:hypothetical protein
MTIKWLFYFTNMVGVIGFEPMTSRPPGARATKLRYTPITKRSHNKFYQYSRGVTNSTYVLRINYQ